MQHVRGSPQPRLRGAQADPSRGLCCETLRPRWRAPAHLHNARQRGRPAAQPQATCAHRDCARCPLEPGNCGGAGKMARTAGDPKPGRDLIRGGSRRKAGKDRLRSTAIQVTLFHSSARMSCQAPADPDALDTAPSHRWTILRKRYLRSSGVARLHPLDQEAHLQELQSTDKAAAAVSGQTDSSGCDDLA